MKISLRVASAASLFLAVACSNDVTFRRSEVEVDSSIPFSFGLTANEVKSTCDQERLNFIAKLDRIGGSEISAASFTNTVLAMENAGAEFNNKVGTVSFLKYVSSDADVRAAADECETAISQLFVDVFVREDLYTAIKAVKQKGESLSEDSKLLIEDYLSSFRRNGLELPPEQRALFIEKKKALVKLEADFSTNLNEYQDDLIVTREELEGLPESYIAGLTKTEDGKYRVSLDYPRYYPFMENAKNADARRRLEFKFSRRGGVKNKQLLDQAITLRRELAKLLGYPTHAAFVLEKRMAENPEKVNQFLTSLVDKLIPKGKSDLAELVRLKQEDTAGTGDDEIHAWDWRYYDSLLKKKKYEIDSAQIREYFPLDVVMGGMFEIYQTLLGVEFVAAPELPRWHVSVLPYAIRKDGKTVAYFYMDLFPRAGKYGHAAAFTLLSGYLKGDGSYRAPVSSIVANFNPPLPGAPSLLDHSEVETLFHEFGHIMHQVLTTATYASFSGTNVKRDFVEAPSQMLESWVWEAPALEKLSGHYLDPSKKLPPELVKKMVDAKLVNSGIRYLRQAAFATLDLEYHTAATVDTTEVYARAMRDIMLIPIQEDTYPEASFGHLMGGYDSGYYGYLWSEVYAADMYTRFADEGLLNPKTGGDYLKWILQPGGAKDPFALITGFLGREPNQDAFLKSIGL